MRKRRAIYKSVKYLIKRSDVYITRFSLAGKKALIYAPQFVYGTDVAEGLIEAGAKLWLCGLFGKGVIAPFIFASARR